MTDLDERDTLRNWLTTDGSGARTLSGPQSPVVVPGSGAAHASAEAVAKSDEDPRPRFDPHKFQRITLPPGLRADFIRWSRAARDEKVPDDTLPPNARTAQQAHRGNPAAESGIRPSLRRWVRNVATGAVLVALFVGTTLVVARWGRREAPANTGSVQPAPTQTTAPVTQPLVLPIEPLPIEQPAPVVADTSAPVAHAPAAVPPPTALPEHPGTEAGEQAPTLPGKKSASTERRDTDAHLTGPMFKPAPEAPRSESAFDRPFSPPR